MRNLIAAELPGSEQCIAYGVPCFKVDGKGIAGFAFYKDHCTYFSMSGSITTELSAELRGFVTAKGSIQFATDEPLPAELVRRLIEARQQEIERSTK